MVYFLKNQEMFFSHSISRTMVDDNWKSYKDFVIASIDDGYCVHCLVNTFHIKEYKDCYKKVHFIYNITFCGMIERKKFSMWQMHLSRENCNSVRLIEPNYKRRKIVV